MDEKLFISKMVDEIFLIYVTFVVAKDEDWKPTWDPTLDYKSCKHLFF